MAKRAVFVVINDYRQLQPDGGANLRGCLSDGEQWKDVLTKLGWLESDIRTLKDGQATRENIVAAAAWLVAGAQPGDQLFLQYSGHGSYVNVPSVGIRPIICFSGPDVFKRPLTFKDMGEVLQVPEGVALTCIMDCCHSGARMREFNPHMQPTNERKPRFLSPPEGDMVAACMELAATLPPVEAGTGQTLTPAAASEAARALIEAAPVADRRIVSNNFTVALTGCTLQQTSADAFIGGQYRGAFTAYAVELLKSFGYSLPYATLIAKVNALLKAHGYTQNPQFEGDPNYANLTFMAVPVVTTADATPDVQPAGRDGDVLMDADADADRGKSGQG